jgi:transposase-like protein
MRTAAIRPRACPSLAGLPAFPLELTKAYPGVVRRLGKDLPELLAFFRFPRRP